MTKAEIINKIAEETGVAKKDVAATVEAFMEEIRVSLADNKENVYLRGFGTFVVKRRAQKTARNISKNTTIVIDAHDYPTFKPSKSFIEKMKYAPHKTGDVVMLTGIGEVYPFMRAHILLDAMQADFNDLPVVVMYPGSYDGNYLKLFNTLEASPYYRAFNMI